MRYTTEIYEQIHAKYTPMLTVLEEDDTFEVPDPRALWVGPFYDGLIKFSIFHDGNTGRPDAKAFFWQAGLEDNHGFEFLIERCVTIPDDEEWPYPGATYAQTMNLRSLHTEASKTEPGEIKNSPDWADAEGDIWERKPGVRAWDPEIWVDSRFGLHVLYRGDKNTKRFKLRTRSEMVLIEEVFVLRPTTEGLSKVEIDEGLDQTIV